MNKFDYVWWLGFWFLKEEKVIVLMNMVWNVLLDKRNYGFVYSERSVWIFFGEEEGVFVWIIVNYYNGFFFFN